MTYVTSFYTQTFLLSVMLLLALLLACVSVCLADSRPIIGIMTQPCPAAWRPACSSSFINSDYVKWLEASGARVVPVHYNASHQDLLSLFSSINGLVYPGGDDILNRTQYYYAAKLLFDAAVEANKMGDVFPLWGTCLGFQFLNVAVYGSVDILSRYDAENISLPLTFTNASPSSQLWSHASPYTIKYLSSNNATENVHHFGVSPEDFLQSPALSKFYDILSTSVDRQGRVFISSMEAHRYPFFGVQYHPERSIFNWNPFEAIDHSHHTIAASQYVGRRFIMSAARSRHRFADEDAENAALIDNFAPFFSRRYMRVNMQMYFF